jgi:hypothetical protein
MSRQPSGRDTVYARMNDEQRTRHKARTRAGVALRRGHITRGPCESCGNPDAQMHHDDYTKPLDVRWLCRPCHIDHHRNSV